MAVPMHVDLGKAALPVVVKRDGAVLAEGEVRSLSFHDLPVRRPHAELAGDVTLTVHGRHGPCHVVFDLHGMVRALSYAIGVAPQRPAWRQCLASERALAVGKRTYRQALCGRWLPEDDDAWVGLGEDDGPRCGHCAAAWEAE